MEMRLDPRFRDGLIERRRRLEEVMAQPAVPPGLVRLLAQVDDALARWDAGTYGLCDACHDPVEEERLRVDPFLRLCLDHLDDAARSDLERDLSMATRVQRALLPKAGVAAAGWEFGYRFEAAGVVSGDYCDVLTPRREGEGVLFAVGDVSGKGVAASLLSSHLSALFRTLRDVGLSVPEMMERANRMFCESTLEAQYATLVLGSAGPDGVVELCNAGQGTPIHVANGRATAVAASGLPLGMFCASPYGPQRIRLASGDLLIAHTDGVTETRDRDQRDFGSSRLVAAATEAAGGSAQEVADACLAAADRFRGEAARTDDTTVLVLRRTS